MGQGRRERAGPAPRPAPCGACLRPKLNAVIDQLRGLLRAPEIVVRAWRAAWQAIRDISERRCARHWSGSILSGTNSSPPSRARIVQLLVERVDVSPDGANIRLRTEGLASLAEDLRATKPESRKAA